MSQTLQAHAAVSSPVKITDSKTLCANMAALEDLSLCQLKAISIISLSYELKHNSGTDYTATGVGIKQLNIDCSTFFGGIPFLAADVYNKNHVLVRTALDWNAGHAADSTLSTDVNTLLGLVPITQNEPEEKLNRELFFLRYKLAV